MYLANDNRRFIDLSKSNLHHIEYGQFSQDGWIIGSYDDNGNPITSNSGLFDSEELVTPQRIYENQSVIIILQDDDEYTHHKGVVKHYKGEDELYILIPHDLD